MPASMAPSITAAIWWCTRTTAAWRRWKSARPDGNLQRPGFVHRALANAKLNRPAQHQQMLEQLLQRQGAHIAPLERRYSGLMDVEKLGGIFLRPFARRQRLGDEQGEFDFTGAERGFGLGGMVGRRG